MYKEIKKLGLLETPWKEKKKETLAKETRK